MALTYDDISSVTRKAYMEKLVDNIFTSNTLLKRARQKGWYAERGGGTKILVPVMYATNSSGGWFGGTGTFDTTDNEISTAAEFDWKTIVKSINISHNVEVQNASDEEVINLVGAKVQNAEESLADTLGTGLYNAGTTSNAIIGLRLAVDSAGTYGGISRTTYSWWSAQEDSTTTALSIAAMQSIYGDATVGASKPTVITTTQDVYDDYFGLLQPQQRFTSGNSANGGFTELMFNATPVLVDNHCPASHMFFLNEKYLKLCVSSKFNFKFEPFQKNTNELSAVAKIIWAGALTCSNCRMQGKLGAIA